MRNARLNYVVVGLFVLAMLGVLVVSLGLLAGRTGATDTYYTSYDNVTGVVRGTQVSFEGYPIGHVERVVRSPDPKSKRFRVELAVTEGWPIPADSVARINLPGVLSAFTIDIEAGASGELLDPGRPIHGEEIVNVFSLVSSLADQIRTLIDNDVRRIVDALANAVPDVVADVQRITDRLDTSTERVAMLLSDQNIDGLERVVTNFGETSDHLLALSRNLDSSRRQVDDVIGRVNEILDENSGEVGQIMLDVQHTLESVARHIDAINQNLEGTSRNMYEFTRQIRQDPSRLIRGTDREEPDPNGVAPAALQ